jgi:hypothetical protein
VQGFVARSHNGKVVGSIEICLLQLNPGEQSASLQNRALGRAGVSSVGGEFPSCPLAAHRTDSFVITPNVLRDRAVAFLTPTGMLKCRPDRAALVLLGASQTVVTVRSPRMPKGIAQCPDDDFDIHKIYPIQLPGGGDSMVAVDKIVLVPTDTDHEDRG